eukprot:1629779-Amphidinium_carterae.1
MQVPDHMIHLTAKGREQATQSGKSAAWCLAIPQELGGKCPMLSLFRIASGGMVVVELSMVVHASEGLQTEEPQSHRW